MELSCGIFTNNEIYKNIDVVKLKGGHRDILGEKHKNSGIMITKFLAGVLLSIDGMELPTDQGKLIKLKESSLRRATQGDRDLIILELKKMTKKREMEANHFCPYCRKTNLETIILDEIEIRKLKNPKVINGNPVVDFEFEGIIYVVRIPLGEDEERIANLARKNAIKAQRQLFQNCLVSINGNTDIPHDYAKELDTDILDEIVSEWESVLPGPQLTKYIECYHCEREFQSVVDFSDFLLGSGSRKR